ncbi:MAG: ABC transporter ATP-binding protein/permease [Candidatus Binataceae bacterium]
MVDRFDRLFWKRFWLLVKPYWTSEERRPALMLLVTVLVLSGIAVALNAVFSFVSRDLMNTLQAHNAARFYHLMMLYVVWIVIAVPILAFYPYLTGLLSIRWRDWVTDRFVQTSFAHRALYHIVRDHSVDNPDQRISEDINSFTSGALKYSLTILRSIITAATFFGILWSISYWLALCLIGYALLGTWLAIVIGRRLVVINFDQQRYEADYRFALVHARDNAEEIALYRGEQYEERQLKGRFVRVVNNFKLLILWQRHLTLFTATYENAAMLVPYFVLAGAYFSGRFQLGEFTQAAYAFAMLQSALSLVVNQFEGLTDYASVVNRLAFFKEQCARATLEDSGAGQIEVVEDDARLALENLTLMTPDRSRTLQRGLTAEARPGRALLITGPSGAGKTSVMRAVAGLWSAGGGRIIRPPLDEIIFLPQRPYMILGTLRDQLCYPRAGGFSDEQLRDVLTEVNLANLPERVGGLDADKNWAEILSTGEQQRLAFARMLLNRPRYAFLDEATSGLDLATEELLYERLARTPICFVSVGHRPSLRRFHQNVVEFRDTALDDSPNRLALESVN